MLRARIVAVGIVAGITVGAAGAIAAPATRPAGSVRGTVIFEGEPPAPVPVSRDGDPYCARGDRTSDDVIVTRGKLKDVVVRIKNGSLPGAAARTGTPPPAVIDQRDCRYVPRVIGVVAGQRLVVRNSDGTFHNVHGTIAGKLAWNKPAMAGAPDLSLDGSPRAGDVIELACDVHPWMHAYVVVHDHPVFVVTGEDGGFELTGLPAGSYTVEAWHPVLGTQSVAVKIGAGPKAAVTARLAFRRQDLPGPK